MRSLSIAFVFLLTSASPAAAQSLPDWAAPSYSAAESGSADGGFASFVPCPPGQMDDGTGTCIPNPPTQVPLDGGLGLLALAGGAYAALRLQRRD